MLTVYFKYSLKFLKRNKFLSLIAVIQIAISVLLLNFSLGAMKGTCMQLIYTKGLNKDSFYIVQPSAALIEDGELALSEEETNVFFYNLLQGYCEEQRIPVPDTNSEEYYSILNSYDCFVRYYVENRKELLGVTNNYYLHDDMKQIVDKVASGSEIYNTYSFSFPPIDANGIILNSFDIMDEALANDVYVHLSKGKQFAALHSTGKQIEAIAYGDENLTNSFRVGDEFDIILYNYELKCYEPYTIRIAGIMSSPFYLMKNYMSFTSGEQIDLDTIVSRQRSSDYTGYAGLLIKTFDGFSPEKYGAGYFPQRYFVNIENSEYNYEKLESTLTTAGYEIASCQSAWQNSFHTIMTSIVSYSILLIISILMSFLTLFGVSILHVNNHWHSHEIMKICGARYFDHIGISMILLLQLSILGSIIGGIGVYLSRRYEASLENSEFYGMILDESNIYFTVGLLLLILIILNIIVHRIFRPMREV